MKRPIAQLILSFLLLFFCSIITGQTSLSGTIETDSTLRMEDSPYVIHEELYVFSLATLTIEPGVIIKFTSEESHLQIDGVLEAIGTTDQPIIFTSIKDDTHGGDTNVDGANSVPAPGDWEGITFYGVHNGNKASHLEHCWIGYGGTWSDGAIEVRNGIVNLSNSTICHSESNGIEAILSSIVATNCLFETNLEAGITFRSFPSFEDLGEINTVTLKNNTFTDNEESAVKCTGFIQNVEITLENNTSSGSKGNGFAIEDYVIGTVNLKGHDNFPILLFHSLIVGEESTLNISPGTVFKFFESSLRVDGTLIAKGTPQDSIKFTSLANDNIAGDSNGDGNSTQPSPGQWGGIHARNGLKSNVHLEYCHLSYGGNGLPDGLVDARSDNVIVKNSLLKHSILDGIFAKHCSPTIENNIFSNNSHGLYCKGLSHEKPMFLKNNTFLNNKYGAAIINLKDNTVNIKTEGNTAFGNKEGFTGVDFTQNGVTLKGTIAGDVTYTGQSDAFPFLIFNTISINNEAKLNLAPGTVFKGNGLIEVFGTLNARGTENVPIVFTSLDDDSYAGDTNDDGSASTPKKGDSGSISFKSSTKESQLENCIFRYGGVGTYYYPSDKPGHIYVKGDDVRINNCLIEYGGDAGVYVVNASPTLENNVIRNNKKYGIYTEEGALPTIKYNNIYDNPQAGVFNDDGSFIVDARDNWWGDPSGPYHPSKNNNGLGNEVTDFVLFDPWLEEPVEDVLSSTEFPATSSNNLFHSYPNPFSNSTTVYFELEQSTDVFIDLLDASGKQIKNITNAYKPAGAHQVEVPGKDLEQGIYFLRLTTNQGYDITRLVHMEK